MNEKEFQEKYLIWAHHINSELEILKIALSKVIETQDSLTHIAEILERRCDYFGIKLLELKNKKVTEWQMK